MIEIDIYVCVFYDVVFLLRWISYSTKCSKYDIHHLFGVK
jgi:hypothetical protein